MLESNQPISADAGSEKSGAAGSESDRTASPEAGRREGDRRQGDRRQGDRRQGDRRQGDRRSIDTLRADLEWTRAPGAQNQGFGGKLLGVLRDVKNRPARVLVLLVALLSGGMAAFLLTQRNEPIPQPVTQMVSEVIAEKKTQILVASTTIGVGQRLSPKLVTWEDWPEGSVRADYVTISEEPEAIADMAGSVARFEFFPGEPIRQQKLAEASEGYLSAILASGMRGVSVSVTAESASGGFINPNDHVDVVLTRSSSSRSSSPDESSGAVLNSQTILNNVRVLAINERLGSTGTNGASKKSDETRAEIFTNMVIATLELDPSKAEVLISATTLGQLSLVLRSVGDFAENDKIEQRGTNQAIRISSPFWLK